LDFWFVNKPSGNPGVDSSRIRLKEIGGKNLQKKRENSPSWSNFLFPEFQVENFLKTILASKIKEVVASDLFQLCYEIIS
jgi:hypothetical protein